MNVDFRQWFPVKLTVNDGRIFVSWMFIGEKRFTEPFLHETIEVLLRSPLTALFRVETPIETLAQLAQADEVLAPAGFIHHVSRCGSTLVAQMLAACERFLVLSEPPLIEQALSLPLPENDKITVLQWVVKVMSRRRAVEERSFITFDCWSASQLALLEKAFPDVKWIFMYREPLEVIVSNQRLTGMQMIPGKIPGIFPDKNLDEILRLPEAERLARTIGAFYRSGLEHASRANCRLVEYRQLPEIAMTLFQEHFGLELTTTEVKLMSAASRRDAKVPSAEFKPDSASKQRDASPEIRAATDEFVQPFYFELERLRGTE